MCTSEDAPSPVGAAKHDAKRQREPGAGRQPGGTHGLGELRGEVPMAQHSVCCKAQHPFILPSPEPASEATRNTVYPGNESKTAKKYK